MNKEIVAVVGLGYVGLPLAIEFGKKFKTIGYDLSEKKISAYKKLIDPTGEISEDMFRSSKGLTVTNDSTSLSEADFIIVAVPTPVTEDHQPDFSPLVSSSTTVGKRLKAGATVIYESTVYPGATEEICIPILERESGLKWKKDFNVGYSPERINPGDKERTLTKIVKVVSGDNEQTLEKVAELYGSVVLAGVYRASSIKVAEAAKVIENTQRDLNIALMNELAVIFNRIGIDTLDVLKAAETKWNFLPFRPGLVGGHCIGVDPYYLTHKAEMLGYHPQVILAGRHINDNMAAHVVQQTIDQLSTKNISARGAKVIVLGLTFKENCPDLRNSKVADVVKGLEKAGCEVYAHDPVAKSEDALLEYEIKLFEWESLPAADALVVAVPHKWYLSKPLAEILKRLKPKGVFLDVKSAFDSLEIRGAGYNLWRL